MLIFIFISQMKDALLHILKTHRKMMPQTSELDNVTLAETYAVMIFYLVKRWLKGPSNAKEYDFLKDAVLMCHSSLYDFID